MKNPARVKPPQSLIALHYSDALPDIATVDRHVTICVFSVLVIDSECLHCGGPTHHLSKWSTTCTVQICSTQGW